MKLSRQADYAIRTVMELARVPSGRLLQTREIARRQEIPVKYLPTIVRTLARAGIVRTLRGSQGGIALARIPEQVSLLDVIEAIDGPVLLNRCRIRPGECGGEKTCGLHGFWEKLVASIEKEMRAANFRVMSETNQLPG